MRLLFDENLSFRLDRELADVYPDSVHVRDIGLLGAVDQAVWAYAAQQGLLLTSKDTDFYQRSMVLAAPSVVWLRVGRDSGAAAATIRYSASVLRRSRRYIPPVGLTFQSRRFSPLPGDTAQTPG